MILNRIREKISEDDYIHIEENVISQDNNFTDINTILDALSSLETNNDEDIEEAACQMIDLMNNESNKNHPFFLFLPSIDLSWSIIKKMNDADKTIALSIAIVKYLAHRYVIYNSEDTLGVLSLLAKDRGSSRKNGESARKKITNILEEIGYSHSINADTFSEMDNNSFALVDKTEKRIYDNFIDSLNISTITKNKYKSKKPDFAIKNNSGAIYLIEHKHLKESGGAQDKQFEEVLSFVERFSDNEEIISMGFVDGYFYNTLLDAEEEYEAGINRNKMHGWIERLHTIYEENEYLPLLNTQAFIDLFDN